MKQGMRMLALVLGIATISQAQGECSDSALSPAARKYIAGTLTNRKEPVLVFVIRFSDFGCELCLNSFLDFCDSLLAGKARVGRGRVEIFFTRDGTPETYQETTMRQWLRGNGIDFPLHIIPPEFLEEEHFDHSIVYLLSKVGKTEYCGLIPLPWKLQESILVHFFSG